MRIKGTDRKGLEAIAANSPAVSSYSRLYPSASRRTVDIIASIAADYEAQGMALLFEVPDVPAAQFERLRADFDLTASEAMLALHIAGGGNIASHAAARDTSRNTVRNQLQQIFEKTGVRRQAELVKLLIDY